MPDILGFDDFTSDTELTYGLIRDRVQAPAFFADGTLFPLPKGDGTKLRSLSVLNPLDELVLRIMVGRCTPAIAHSVDEDRVFNGLIVGPGPRWVSADFRTQHRARRDRQRELYDADATAGIAFFDVKDFFSSCRHGIIEEKLLEIGAPAGAVVALIGFLGTLFPTGRGLPIGFEGSGPLANLLLDPVDRALDAAGLQSVRWTDDLDVFLTDMDQADEIYDLVASELASVGLRINADKFSVLAKGRDAEQRLLDPSRDSLFDDNAVTNIVDALDWDITVRSVIDLIEEIPAPHLRSYLGKLAAERHPGALDYLKANPAWLDREPNSVGRYLAAIAKDPAARSKLDLDWMMSLAVGRDPTGHTAAGQLHMCRALAEFHLDPARGRQMLDFAVDYETLARRTPLGAWASRAWATSQAWSPTKAKELIDTVQPVNYRRAAASGFIGKSPSKHLAQIVVHHPDLGPLATLAHI